MEFYNASQVISGTFGEAWLDGEKYADIYGLQAKINILKEDVPMCGTKNGKGKKQMGWDGTGSLRFNKVDSRLLKKQVAAHKAGKEVVLTIISKLADPSSNGGAERIALKNCTFDDITLVDWEANKLLQQEVPFTFDDYDLIDSI